MSTQGIIIILLLFIILLVCLFRLGKSDSACINNTIINVTYTNE